MDNLLYDPELNPVIFYDEARATTDEYQTPHFEDFPWDERGHDWLQGGAIKRVWQTTDIIEGQFSAQFDPIIISLLDIHGVAQITLPALIGLPNIYYPNTWSFEYSMSLAGLPTGCYRMKRLSGTGGTQKTHYTDWMYISADPIPGTLWVKYWHDRFFKDVIFETGKEFGLRIPGWLDYDRQARKTKKELYRDETYNQTVLNSKSAKNIPVYFGDEFGLPTDLTNILELAWECNHVEIDNKPFAIAEGAEIEFIDIEGYRNRGMHTVVEPGINRGSRITTITSDATKKLTYGIMVDKKVFGDTSNQGSGNTVPILTVE